MTVASRQGPRHAVFAVVICVLLSTAGCTAGETHPTAKPPATAPTTSVGAEGPADAPQQAPRDPQLSDIPAGTVIATGAFTGRSASVAGTIEVLSTGFDDVKIQLFDVAFDPVPGATIAWSSLEADASTDALREAWSYYQYSEVKPGSGKYLLTALDLLTTDPSWIRSATIWAPAENGLQFGRALGVAPISWSLPDMRPDLAVQDAGPMPAAAGTAILIDGAAPSAYVVAEGDVLSVIAGRFGLDVDDVAWLNPGRGDDYARAGETLNLSRAARGKR